MEGPDRVVDTEDVSTWKANGYCKIRGMPHDSKDPEYIPPLSLVTAIKSTCESSDASELIALKVKRDNQWISWTYSEYYRDIKCVARAFVHIGLEPRHAVAICGFNSPEWFLSEMACIFAGGMAVGLYPTNSLEMNKYILANSRANILVVENESMGKEILKYKQDLPLLKMVVVWSGVVSEPCDDIIKWEDLMSIGTEKRDDAPVSERHSKMAINECCLLIYTSGTTGNPKGVMLSHDNIYWASKNMGREVVGMIDKKEVGISYLPLSHVAANLTDIWGFFLFKGTICFADKMALKGTLVETLKEIRPTTFLGVPRVYEKLAEGIKNKALENTGAKHHMFQLFWKAGVQQHSRNSSNWTYMVGRQVFYGKVLSAIGLDRCRSFFSGAAPIANETLQYLCGLDIKVLDTYGMSEAPSTSVEYKETRIGSVGNPIPCCKIKISNIDNKGNGEICLWGRNVMMGYLNEEQKTVEAIDSEGWMHSGDIGYIDADEYLYISGRIKEILITSGGENIAPVPIENAVKLYLPCISNAVLIGDKQKFLSIFLTFKVYIDKETDLPTDNLTKEAILWCQSVGSTATKVSEVLGESGKDGCINAAIQKGVDDANTNAVSRAARINKWAILPSEISVIGGEIGPTLKLKRHSFNIKYQKEIEAIYDSN